MRQHFKPTVERLFVRPVRDLVDTTFLLITNPASVAREYARQDGHQFERAVTYFVAAFSAAVILNKIASWALGVETIQDVPYWAFYGFAVLFISVLAALLAFILGSSPPTLFLKAACLTYGACFLIGSFLVAGASLTLAGLHEVGYIPDFRPDPTSFKNYFQIGMQAFWDCLRDESMLFNVLYNGVEGRFENLNEPIDLLSWLQPLLFLATSLLFAGLAFFGAEHRRWAAAVTAVLSVGMVIGGMALGLVAVLGTNFYETTQCSDRGIQAAEQNTTEDQARLLAEKLTRDIGNRYQNGAILTGVDRQRNSVVLRVQVPLGVTDNKSFPNWVKSKRQEAIRSYCSSEDWATYFRKLGLSYVWVYRYADTDLVETVVQSADQCHR